MDNDFKQWQPDGETLSTFPPFPSQAPPSFPSPHPIALLPFTTDCLLLVDNEYKILTFKNLLSLFLPGCMTNNYNPTQIQTCLPSRRLVFIGDSITRQLFYSMAKLADPTAPDGPPEGGGKHMDQVWKSTKGQFKERDSRFGFRGLKGDELDADFSLPRL